MNEKYKCLDCKFCVFDSGCPAYSEYTPGESAEFKCEMGHWDVSDKMNVGKDKIVGFLNKGSTCKDFEGEE